MSIDRVNPPQALMMGALARLGHNLKLVAALGLIAALGVVQSGCSANPATGQSQLNFFSEAQEIAMGEEAAPQFAAQFGLIQDEELTRYVQDLGAQLAEISERPHLPWEFYVADDPMVNAFALPGGKIFVTRGLLTHMQSEAELVGVLGHEVGHVTGRHSVSQMSKAQVGQIALAVGAIAAGPQYARTIGDLGGAAMQMLFLQYGRNHENQADTLGVRYGIKTGWDPAAMPRIMRALGRVEASHGGSQMPNWMRSHPTHDRRIANLNAEIAKYDAVGGRDDRNGFLRRLEGMMFGVNPREGYARDGVYYHPDLAFWFRYPKDWNLMNQRDKVVAVSPDQNAFLWLSLAQGKQSAGDAAYEFFSQPGMQAGNHGPQALNGLPSVVRQFRAQDPNSPNSVDGWVAFVEHQGLVFRFLGATPGRAYRQYGGMLEQSLGSFGRLTDQRILSVQPQRLKLLNLNQTGPLSQQPQLRDQDINQLLLINNLDANQPVEKGTLIKVIEGKLP